MFSEQDPKRPYKAAAPTNVCYEVSIGFQAVLSLFVLPR